MTIYYNGKYPNRVESVWRVAPTRLYGKGQYTVRTNIGALYTFKPSPLLLDIGHLLGVEVSSIPGATFVENSVKRKPGKRWRLLNVK